MRGSNVFHWGFGNMRKWRACGGGYRTQLEVVKTMECLHALASPVGAHTAQGESRAQRRCVRACHCATQGGRCKNCLQLRHNRCDMTAMVKLIMWAEGRARINNVGTDAHLDERGINVMHRDRIE